MKHAKSFNYLIQRIILMRVLSYLIKIKFQKNRPSQIAISNVNARYSNNFNANNFFNTAEVVQHI